MRTFIVFILMSVYWVSPVFATSSQFLEDISGVIQIQPQFEEKSDGRLVLKNCSVRSSALGEGSIGQMIIINEGPERLGELILESVRFKELAIQSVSISNLSGNFTVLAATFPYLAQIQLMALQDSKKVYELFDSLKPFLPALKKFHMDKLEIKGVEAGNASGGILLDKISYSDFSLTSIGESQIDNLQLNMGPVVAFTVNNAGFQQVKIPDLEAFLSINHDEIIDGLLSPQDIQALSNFTIKDFYVKNIQVPIFNVALEDGNLDIDMKEGNLKGKLNINGLRMPGKLLSFLELQNLPMRVTFNGALAFMALINEQGIDSKQKFAVDGSGLFDLDGGFGLVMDHDENIKELTNLDLNFINKGIISMVSGENKFMILKKLQIFNPALVDAVHKIFSGEANTISLKAEDAKNPQTYQIDVE